MVSSSIRAFPHLRGGKRISVETVSLLRKASLPLSNGDRIDLEGVFNSLKQTDIKACYDPESNMKAVYVKVGRISCGVFSNGKVMIAGKATKIQEEKILFYLWNNYLKHSLL